MRILAIIFGVLLLLPGLCFLGFGVTFATNRGSWPFGLIELVIGGLITWGAVALIAGKSR
jgi:hypothetical protein